MKRMTLYISTWDGMVGFGAVCITGDGVVDYRNADLNWGRCGWEWGNRSLLRTQLWGMVLKNPTRDDAEENDTAYLYWGRCGRVWRCISLLETVW